jgi:hypothetical protein
MSEPTTKFIPSPEVTAVVEEIAALAKPTVIYLYNQRVDAGCRTTSFKLCVVAGVEDKDRAMREIYRGVDCVAPFDVLIYTDAEWRELTEVPTTFASKIMRTGTVMYRG